jgi:nucleotide-binding universal stress UspA family protein
MDESAPVAVGIDGSKSALRAAFWAVDEATSRDTSLRLIHVVDTGRDADHDEALAKAQHVLHVAWEAIAATGKPVKLESEILYGSPAETLVEASNRCALMCLGHKGTHDSPPGDRGATVGAVVRKAHSSVAIVRRRANRSDPSYHRWIVVVLDDSSDSHELFQTAAGEAILRRAPLLALTAWSGEPSNRQDADGGLRATLGGLLEQSGEDPADVPLCSLPMPKEFLNLLRQSASIDQLLVIGQGRRDLIDDLTAAATRKILHKSWCSVLVVRGHDADHSGVVPF